MKLQLPESVHRFCTDARTASAVELLLSGRSPKIPDGLAWDELEDFYRACLAAQQTRIEWSIAMSRLWTAIFADLTAGWRPSTITRQAADSGTDLGVESVWRDGEFTRDLTRDDLCLELQIEFASDEGVRANVSVWRKGRALALPPPEGAEVVDGWICSRWLEIHEDPELDLTSLRHAAGLAVQEANRAAAFSS